MTNISEINGFGIYAQTASLALTSSYIDPTFISASAAASGFGSGGGSTDTGSLLTTASFSDPNLTFTKGDGSTFNVNISPIVYKSTIDSAELVGVTGYSLMKSQLIPAGTFQPGDVIRIRSRIQKTNNGAIYGSHIYIRNIDVLPGATLLATYNTTGTTIRSSQIKRDFVIKSPTQTESFFVTTSLITDEIAGTSQPLSLTNIDWTVDQYIMFVVNTTSLTDRFIQTYYIIEKL